MSDKAARIQELIDMQKKFIEHEHKNGFSAKEYFTPEAGDELDGYRQTFMEKSMELVDIAHAEKGSHRQSVTTGLKKTTIISGFFLP